MTDGLLLARVVGVHPGDQAVDLVFLHDGSRAPKVQYTSGLPIGTDFGHAGIPRPDGAGDGEDTGGRDIIAVVALFRRLPVVIGFLPPQVCAVLFDEPGRVVHRTPSDVYCTTDAEGNTELYHPSGTFLRIATTAAHEDLTGKDRDGKWAITRNTSKAVHVQLTVANAGAQKASLHIDPNGNASLEHDGNLTVTTGGGIAMTAEQAFSLQAASVSIESTSGAVAVTSASNFTATAAATAKLAGAAVNLDGPLSLTGGDATGTGSLSMTGPVNSSTDVTASGISLVHHKHTEQGDGQLVSEPVAS